MSSYFKSYWAGKGGGRSGTTRFESGTYADCFCAMPRIVVTMGDGGGGFLEPSVPLSVYQELLELEGRRSNSNSASSLRQGRCVERVLDHFPTELGTPQFYSFATTPTRQRKRASGTKVSVSKWSSHNEYSNKAITNNLVA